MHSQEQPTILKEKRMRWKDLLYQIIRTFQAVVNKTTWY